LRQGQAPGGVVIEHGRQADAKLALRQRLRDVEDARREMGRFGVSLPERLARADDIEALRLPSKPRLRSHPPMLPHGVGVTMRISARMPVSRFTSNANANEPGVLCSPNVTPSRLARIDAPSIFRKKWRFTRIGMGTASAGVAARSPSTFTASGITSPSSS